MNISYFKSSGLLIISLTLSLLNILLSAPIARGEGNITQTSDAEIWESSNSLDLLTDDKVLPALQPTIIASSYRGHASWYGPGFHGRLTANGEIFNQNALTAAHRTLRFGTKVRVTNLNNGRSVVVRINDRGPFIKGRIIDVSAAAARNLGMVQSGVAPVKITILGR